jgi:hypothetical protein
VSGGESGVVLIDCGEMESWRSEDEMEKIDWCGRRGRRRRVLAGLGI